MILILILTAVIMAGLLLQVKDNRTGTKELENLMPVWKIEDGAILSKHGDITLAMRVELPEIFSLSNEEYEALHQVWIKAIRMLVPGMVLHKQDWFTESAYEATSRLTEENFLKASSDRFFHERPYLKHECYLMLSYRPPGRKPASSAFSNLLRRTVVPPESVNRQRLQQVMDIGGQFMRVLNDSGLLRIEMLREEDITGTATRTGLLERYLCLNSSASKPQLKDIAFKPHWKIGNLRCLLFSMADTDHMPVACSPHKSYDKYTTDKTRFSVGFASPIGQLLPVNHIYNQYLIISNPQKTLKSLEAKRLRLQSLSAYSRENQISKEATAQFLNEAISQARTPVKAHFNLHCWTDSEDQLKEIKNQAASSLSQMEVVPHEETIGAPQLWWAGLAGNAAELPENDCFTTFAEQGSCFFNMETAYRSSKSSFGIRLGDRLTGVPIHVDLSDEPMAKHVITNRNKVVIGGSGSGKSVFMCHLLHSYVLQGAHCVVVDVGHSYEGLCELLNGYYFTYSEENPIQFNPFYIAEGDILDTEKKESIKTLLVALWKANDEGFRRSEYVAISNALQSYYQFLGSHPEIFPCFNSFYVFLQEYFIKELEADGVKDRDFDIRNFLYVLRPYYDGGEFSYLLNATENLDVLFQPFIVFELDKVKDHPILFPVITLIIMELFVSKMRKLKGIRKVIVIEEAWKAIARAGMAEFIKYLYKTVRKYFGEAIVVTQEIDDIISSPIIKEAILNNADCKILLDLKKFQNKFTAIQSVLGMTDKGRDLVLSVNRANDPTKKYREVYIELGIQVMKVYRYEPSIEEYYAYSTEQSEKLKVREYAARYGGDIRRGLRALAAEIRESG